jgi:hypothetical protein
VRARVALVVAACAGVLPGCVAPAPDVPSYEQKAATAAQAALSAARSALVSERAHRADRLPSTYLEPVLVDAEEALGSVRTSFDSVQPPTGADGLRRALDPLLEKAGSAVTDMRIAARRDAVPDLSSAASDLSATAKKLEAFSQEHGG